MASSITVITPPHTALLVENEESSLPQPHPHPSASVAVETSLPPPVLVAAAAVAAPVLAAAAASVAVAASASLTAEALLPLVQLAALNNNNHQPLLELLANHKVHLDDDDLPSTLAQLEALVQACARAHPASAGR